MKIFNSRTLTVSIDRPTPEVYEFIVNPNNLVQWASVFCHSVRVMDGQWIVETPDGDVTFEFVTRNEWGILDHRIRMADGGEIVVPMRVIENGAGSEVLFTLFQLSGISDEKFDDDVWAVKEDLHSLKRVLEA